MSQFDGEVDLSKNSTMLQLDSADEVQGAHQVTTVLHDLTQAMEVRVSSRAALCSSLIDDSTETFWESGDEDRFVSIYVQLKIFLCQTPVYK